MVKAQEYLNQNYPNYGRREIRELDLSNKNLKGDLDLTDFGRLWKINVLGNPKLGEIISRQEQNFIIETNVQDWINKKYPNKREIKEIKPKNGLIGEELIITDFPQLEEIEINGWNLTKFQISNCPQLVKLDCKGNKLNHLEITDCPSLKEINCCDNEITELDISIFPNLITLNCSSNGLTNLDLSENQKLRELSLSNNNFPEQDLSFLSHLVSLKKLELKNNHFTGSLKPLKNMTELEYLDINDTDIKSGLEYLSNSIENFYCLNDSRPRAKVKFIRWELSGLGKPEEEKGGYNMSDIIGYNFANLLLYWKKDKQVQKRSQKIEQLLEELVLIERSSRDKAKLGNRQVETAEAEIQTNLTSQNLEQQLLERVNLENQIKVSEQKQKEIKNILEDYSISLKNKVEEVIDQQTAQIEVPPK